MRSDVLKEFFGNERCQKSWLAGAALPAAGVLLTLLFPLSAHAATPVEEEGVLIGLDDVQVTVGAETRDYDVRFVNGTCADAYGACAEDNFTFLINVGAAGVDARDASSILAAAIPQQFKDDVASIRGCEIDPGDSVALCTFLTTGSIIRGTGGPRVTYGTYRAAPAGSGLSALGNSARACDFSAAGTNVVWAVWRLSSDGSPGPVGEAGSDTSGQNLYTECPAPPPAQPDLDLGLVAYYPFSGDATDASGNGNDGTVIGATLTTDRFGNPGQAYDFDGFSSYISVPNSPSLASPESGLTLNAWFRADAWSSIGSDFGPLLMKSDTSANDLQYRLAVTPGGVNGAVNEFLNSVQGGPTPPFDEWHMATFVVLGDEATVYYDGQPVASGTIDAPILDDSQPLEIGRDTPGLLEHFDGAIDEVRVYNRALSAEETELLYDSEAPPSSADLSLTIEPVSGIDNEGVVAVKEDAVLRFLVSNAALVSAQDVTVTYVIESEVSLVSFPVGCIEVSAANGDELVCNLGAIAPASDPQTPGTLSLDIAIRISDDSTVRAEVTSSTPDPDPSNNNGSLDLIDPGYENDLVVNALGGGPDGRPLGVVDYGVGFELEWGELARFRNEPFQFEFRADKRAGLAGLGSPVRISSNNEIISGAVDCLEDDEEEAFVRRCTLFTESRFRQGLFFPMDVVEPGSFDVSARVGSRVSYDPDPSNNFATSTLVVTNPDAFTLRAIEVTQALQDWNNSVPLFQSKPTVARVFLEDPNNTDSLVTGVLHGARNGVPLPGSPLQPLGAARVPAVAADPWVRNRGDLNLDFRLPISWPTFDELTLRFELVSPAVPLSCLEPDGTGDCEVDVVLEPSPKSSMKLYQMGFVSDERIRLTLNGREAVEGRFRILSPGATNPDWIDLRATAAEIQLSLLASGFLGLAANELVVFDDAKNSDRFDISIRNQTDIDINRLILRVELDPPGDPDSKFSATLNGLRDGGQVEFPSLIHTLEQWRRMERGLPAARVSGVIEAIPVAFGFQPVVNEVNTALRRIRTVERALDPAIPSGLRYAAHLATGPRRGGIGQAQDIVFTFFDRGVTGPIDVGYARNNAMHEIYHSYGKPHAVVLRIEAGNVFGGSVGLCGSRAFFEAALHPYVSRLNDSRGRQLISFPDDSWPLIGPLERGPDEEIWGYETRFAGTASEMRVINPRSSAALMSYCGRPLGVSTALGFAVDQMMWPAKNAYEAVAVGIREGFVGTPEDPGYVKPEWSGPVAVVDARFGDRSEVTDPLRLYFFERASALIRPTLAEPSSSMDDVEITLYDELDQPVVRQLAALIQASDPNYDGSVESPPDEPAPPSFTATIPLPTTNIRRLEARLGGEVISEVVASPNAPELELLAPVGVRRLDEPFTVVAWSSLDQDGDALEAFVTVSVDDGATWRVLYFGEDTGELIIPTSELAASDTTRFKVVVSDGFNSAEATSARIQVVNSPPRLVVSALDSDIGLSATTMVQAFAVDAEDGVLDEDDVEWTSDHLGALGNGSPLLIDGAVLGSGCHRVTASVEDSAGAGAQDSVLVGVDGACDEALLERELVIEAPAEGFASAIALKTNVEAQASIEVPPGERVVLRSSEAEFTLHDGTTLDEPTWIADCRGEGLVFNTTRPSYVSVRLPAGSEAVCLLKPVDALVQSNLSSVFESDFETNP